MLAKASHLKQKSEDVETSYKELQQIIQVSVGDTQENWSIAKYIYTYVDRLSNIDNYKKELNKVNKDITIYRDQIESLKEEFVRTKEDIQKLLNPAATISLSNSYKETREKDYKKLLWSMGGNYALFLLPLLLILIYFLYSSLIGIEITSEDRYIDNLLRNISIVIPCSIVSWFGLNSIKKNKHMHDEYNHKQRLMQTYIGAKVENG